MFTKLNIGCIAIATIQKDDDCYSDARFLLFVESKTFQVRVLCGFM